MFKFLVLGLFLIANNVQVAYFGSPIYMPTETSPPVSSVMMPTKSQSNDMEPTENEEEFVEEEEEAEVEIETTVKPTKKHKNPNSHKKGSKGKGGASVPVALGQPRLFE